MTSPPQAEQQAGPPRWLLPAIGLGIVWGSILLWVMLSGSPAPAPAAPTAVPEAEFGAVHGGAAPSAEQVAIDEAKARYDAGTAVFVDVRSGAEYEAGHIAGAGTITSMELEERLRSLPPDTLIVTYDGGGESTAGARAVEIFSEMGYGNVVTLAGGLAAWQAAGYPVASGR